MNDIIEGFVDDPISYRPNATDNVYLSKVLKPITRVVFDPDNQKHREAYANFQINGRWSINFYAEWPSTTIPSTVQRKICEWACHREFAKVKKISK